MRHRLRNLLDFYVSGSGIIVLIGIAAITLRLLDVGFEIPLTLIGIAALSTALPLRLYSLFEGVWLSLEEERRFTHERLVALEDDDGGDPSQTEGAKGD